MLWAEGEEAFDWFMELENYWLHGFSGKTSLDHKAVIERINLFKRGRKKRQWFLRCIEAIEAGVVQAWSDEHLEDDEKNPPTTQQRQQIKERRSRRC